MLPFKVLYYEIYTCPKSPIESGRIYGTTPLLEQASVAVQKAKEDGEELFIKAVCSDGIRRYI